MSTTVNAWEVDYVVSPEDTESEDPGYKVDPSVVVGLLPKLRSVERQLVDLVLFQGLLQREAGERLGMTQAAVSLALRHAYTMLRHWATLPEVGEPWLVREDVQGVLSPVEATILVELISGATMAEVGRRIGRRADSIQHTVVKMRRRAGLPERYLPYLRAHPIWPCNSPRQ